MHAAAREQGLLRRRDHGGRGTETEHLEVGDFVRHDLRIVSRPAENVRRQRNRRQEQRRAVDAQPHALPGRRADPLRRSAPKYWATNVLTYPATPTGKQIIVQYSIPPAMAAASALDEYHSRNIRSTNIIIDQVPVEMNKGSAMASTSRPPQGRDHQLASLFGIRLAVFSFAAGRRKMGQINGWETREANAGWRNHTRKSRS